jgi:quercetin dioxygenase-like cupin family protein
MADRVFAAEGLVPSEWSAGPGYRFGEHHHDHTKVLVCVAGAITFHLATGDIRLGPGDRLDLPAGTIHSATAGPAGVTCREGFK